ncbi:phytanoyl-CoA dioxygenase PhyH [Kribbella steppae]|uniref:Phytanoyl-CoA dioxygenase PhyH n=1 Tax=Kribbella steppae TaxID=2512223 RepID=A0A4R2GXI1_9ACTN|nr:phytanoyl-CoA dioxygenase family protein [Kribbella steppae]TCO15695.1 phytanoyl-CoA dioxygenase PhyH [Kribbella steppae]
MGSETTVLANQSPTRSALTTEQLSLFDDCGYLLVKGMFNHDEVDRGLEMVRHALGSGATTIAWHPSFTDREHTLRIRDAISQCPELATFLDHPRLVSTLIALLSDSVQILGTEIFVRSCENRPLEGWHTDGGEYLQRIMLAPGSQCLQIKCQIFLTDTSQDESGNFLLIPRSHRRMPEPHETCYLDGLNEGLHRGELPDDVTTIHAAPGDALLFPYSLWHAVGPNRLQPRITLIFRYGQLWHRPNDYTRQPAHLLERFSPRLRRMFGDLGDDPHPLEFYKPQDQACVMSVSADSERDR